LKWGSYGKGEGQFDLPTTLTADSSGFIYVTELNNDRVQKFDDNGKFITKWGSVGNGNGQFKIPIGIAVDSTGLV
jgi:tripartite motif-containing protein 71